MLSGSKCSTTQPLKNKLRDNDCAIVTLSGAISHRKKTILCPFKFYVLFRFIDPKLCQQVQFNRPTQLLHQECVTSCDFLKISSKDRAKRTKPLGTVTNRVEGEDCRQDSWSGPPRSYIPFAWLSFLSAMKSILFIHSHGCGSEWSEQSVVQEGLREIRSMVYSPCARLGE